jgi:hypothetical protein
MLVVKLDQGHEIRDTHPFFVRSTYLKLTRCYFFIIPLLVSVC